jgi:hypothetical protein
MRSGHATDLGQTILHSLGIPAQLELRDQEGRPIRASKGAVNRRLIA